MLASVPKGVKGWEKVGRVRFVDVGKELWGEVRYQFYTPVSIDLESFDMFAYRSKKSQSDFLEKDIQNTLIRRSLK
jgi:hypothetical protein